MASDRKQLTMKDLKTFEEEWMGWVSGLKSTGRSQASTTWSIGLVETVHPRVAAATYFFEKPGSALTSRICRMWRCAWEEISSSHWYASQPCRSTR